MSDRWRQEWIHAAGRLGITVDDARLLSRYARTLHRLAELACSSEAADRDRLPCPGGPAWIGTKGLPCLCDAPNGPHGDVPRIAIQDYRTERRAATVVARYPDLRIKTQGDPRGAVLSIETSDGRSVAVW